MTCYALDYMEGVRPQHDKFTIHGTYTHTRVSKSVHVVFYMTIMSLLILIFVITLIVSGTLIKSTETSTSEYFIIIYVLFYDNKFIHTIQTYKKIGN